MGTVTAPVGQVSTDASVGSWVNDALKQAEKLEVRSVLSQETQARIAEAVKVWNTVLFPSPKLEAWKYTNPEAIKAGPFVLPTASNPRAAQEMLSSFVIADCNEVMRLVYVDGVFCEELSQTNSDCKGLSVTRLSQSAASKDSNQGLQVGDLGLHKDDAFAALATALLSDAVVIRVSRGVTVSGPIQIVHLATDASRGCVVTPRVIIDAAESSHVTVIEVHGGKEGERYLSLPVTEIRASQNAKVDHYRIQRESSSAYHVAGLVAEAGRDAEVRNHIFSFGGALVRNNGQLLLKGVQSQALINGLSLLGGTQHVDNTTLIHHIEPSAESREHFKGIYAGESRGVFSGTITVEKIAQKTNAFQSNQALLVSPHASIESRPQLKIWADDVKCTHGATVGQLDRDALFYLRSRGLSEQVAKGFLIHAFASEVLSSVLVPAVSSCVEEVISERLVALAV